MAYLPQANYLDKSNEVHCMMLEKHACVGRPKGERIFSASGSIATAIAMACYFLRAPRECLGITSPSRWERPGSRYIPMESHASQTSSPP